MVLVSAMTAAPTLATLPAEALTPRLKGNVASRYRIKNVTGICPACL